MTCACPNQRIASVSGKTDDRCNVNIGSNGQSDYVPRDMGIGGGDYLQFCYCLECGQIQGKWPLPITKLEESDDNDEIS